MSVYQCWHVKVQQEYIEAPDSFTARKEFARRHHKQVSEVMARRQDLDEELRKIRAQRAASS